MSNSFPTAGAAPQPNIDSYWSFARNPAHQGKHVVTVHENEIGVAEPLNFGDNHVTFLGEEGLEHSSDGHAEIVNHFKKALRNKYASTYGESFISHVFSSREEAEALQQGLSHGLLSQAYRKTQNLKKIYEMPVEELFSNIQACSKSAENACVAASTATNLKKAKEFALNAMEESESAKKMLTRFQEIVALNLDNQKLKEIFQFAQDNCYNTAASAKEAADIVDRNRRLLGGPPLNADYLNKKESIPISSASSGGDVSRALKGPHEMEAVDQERTEQDQGDHSKGGNLKGLLPSDDDFTSAFKRAHEAVLLKIDEEENAQRGFEERRMQAQKASMAKEKQKEAQKTSRVRIKF
jgi:hypothetical protein